MMKSTFHKYVLNAMTAPNPNQYSKSGKQISKILLFVYIMSVYTRFDVLFAISFRFKIRRVLSRKQMHKHMGIVFDSF